MREIGGGVFLIYGAERTDVPEVVGGRGPRGRNTTRRDGRKDERKRRRRDRKGEETGKQEWGGRTSHRGKRGG